MGSADSSCSLRLHGPWAARRDCLPPVTQLAPATSTYCASFGKVPAVTRSTIRLPSAAEARRIARATLEDAGIEVGRIVSTERRDDRWHVGVELAADGRRVAGATMALGVTAKGVITDGNGWLTSVRPAGSYPLAGLDEALRRLRGQGPPSLDDPTMQVFPPGPEPVTLAVTGVRLVLARTYPVTNGWFVPAYEFEIEGRSTVEVPATSAALLRP